MNLTATWTLTSCPGGCVCRSLVELELDGELEVDLGGELDVERELDGKLDVDLDGELDVERELDGELDVGSGVG